MVMAEMNICCLSSLRASWKSRTTTWCTCWRRVETPPGGPKAKSTGPDWHAGEAETSAMLIAHPELVHQDRAKSESGADLGRQKLPENVYTGIWWYARFPNHYSGDGSLATREFGQFRDECLD